MLEVFSSVGKESAFKSCLSAESGHSYVFNIEDCVLDRLDTQNCWHM